MFLDYERLIDQLRKIDPRWQLKALNALEGFIADHADWQREGRPDPKVWEPYKIIRDFGNDLGEGWLRGLRQQVRAAGVTPPSPLHSGEGQRGHGGRNGSTD